MCFIMAMTPAAFAGLSAVGPFNPVAPPGNGFPQWYTDANGVSVDLPIPPAGDGVAAPTMIYAPLTATSNAVAQAAGFDGEAFYFMARNPRSFQTKYGRVTITVGLEASYASGVPAAGDQVVFSRIRIRAAVGVPGTYTFFHPWGSESIPVTAADIASKAKGINFTKDVGLTPGWVSDGAGGWTAVAAPLGFHSVLQPGNTMSTFIRAVAPPPPAGWIGDGVSNSTFTGSPIGHNKFRLEGPAGIDLDGKGNNFIETSIMVISGHIPATLTTPLPLSLDRVTCSFVGGVENIDLWLTSKQGAAIQVTDPLGAVLATGTVTAPRGTYFRSFPGTAKTITVTVTDPLGAFTPTSATTNVIDYLNIIQPSYSLASRILTVQATSSDFFNNPINPPVLTVTGYGPMTLDPLTGIYSLSAPVTINAAPPRIQVTSSVGGSETAPVAIVP
ncbi:MAG: hypothetical protein C4567_13055 [Deltaproteobacteria bacterium]|nr:MAG: hypothetical protein C4567_13055 [Deltaproteobacteria bacterium]